MAEPKWTVRKREWPNGRKYFIVMRGTSEVIVGNGGGESKYYDKSQAQEAADEMNGVKARDNGPELIE